MTATERTWDAELARVLNGYNGDTPLTSPLEDIALILASDDHSLTETRAYIEAARRIGAAGVAEKIKPTLVKTRPALNEAADTIERLTKVCEDTLRWLGGMPRPAASSERAALVRELRKVLGKGVK